MQAITAGEMRYAKKWESDRAGSALSAGAYLISPITIRGDWFGRLGWRTLRATQGLTRTNNADDKTDGGLEDNRVPCRILSSGYCRRDQATVRAQSLFVRTCLADGTAGDLASVSSRV